MTKVGSRVKALSFSRNLALFGKVTSMTYKTEKTGPKLNKQKEVHKHIILEKLGIDDEDETDEMRMGLPDVLRETERENS